MDAGWCTKGTRECEDLAWHSSNKANNNKTGKPYNYRGTFLVGVHGAKKKKGKGKFQVFGRRCPRGIGGLLSSPPADNKEVSFSTVDYERFPIHPPKHGLPANCAIGSWPWLSRVSVLRAPVPCTLVRPCLCKICRVLRWSRGSSTQERHLVRCVIITLNEIFIYSLTSTSTSRYIFGQSDTSTTKLGNGTRTVYFELSAVCGSCCRPCCSMY